MLRALGAGVVSFRFIHAADIHLDSPLSGLSAYEGAPTDMLRTATRRAFTRLMDRALEEQVDFVVIAGDLYDGDWRDYNTGLFLAREISRLHRAHIPTFVLYGNHDAESEITRQLSLPESVHVFSAREPETYKLDELRVALHGQSFRRAATTDNLVVEYPSAVAGYFNIGVLHTALEGDASHARYAPCSLTELYAKEYDYWALGHVHEYCVVEESPRVVFAGNLQGRSVRELGARGAVLVTVEEDQVTTERLLVDVLRWHHLEVDASECQSLENVVRKAGEALTRLVEQQEGHAAAVRVTVMGTSPAHGELFGREAELRANLCSKANEHGEEKLWVEKVRVRTQSMLSPQALKDRSDAVAELQDMLERAVGDAELLESLSAELSDLLAKVPGSLVGRVAELEAVRQGRVDELMQEVSPALIAQLLTLHAVQE